MHEASIVQSLVEEVESILKSSNGSRVVRIHLKIGKLTAVVPDVLLFMFEAIVPGTKLEGAKLTMEEVELRAKCKACGAEDDILEIGFFCGSCGSADVDIIAGRELLIDSLEVEDD